MSIGLKAQELSAQFIVNADLVNQTNQQIFKTLERSVNEFINSSLGQIKKFYHKKK